MLRIGPISLSHYFVFRDIYIIAWNLLKLKSVKFSLYFVQYITYEMQVWSIGLVGSAREESQQVVNSTIPPQYKEGETKSTVTIHGPATITGVWIERHPSTPWQDLNVQEVVITLWHHQSRHVMTTYKLEALRSNLLYRSQYETSRTVAGFLRIACARQIRPESANPLSHVGVKIRGLLPGSRRWTRKLIKVLMTPQCHRSPAAPQWATSRHCHRQGYPLPTRYERGQRRTHCRCRALLQRICHG